MNDALILSSDRYIVIESQELTEDIENQILCNLIVVNECMDHQAKLLKNHRHIWEESRKIVERGYSSSDNLKKGNNILTDYANIVSNIKIRIEQMKLTIDFRKSRTEENYNKLIDYERIDEIMSYLENIFEMTSQYISNNVDYLSTVYDEYNDKSMNKLQIIFLAEVVTQFLMLGNYQIVNNVRSYNSDSTLNPIALEYVIRYGLFTVSVALLIYGAWYISFKLGKPKRRNVIEK